MAVQIRRASIDDLETIVEFNCRLAAESEGKQLNREVILPGVRAVLSDIHKGFYTVAVVDGQVAGQILITYEWSDWRNGWFWWIQSVYVTQSQRGKGIFRLLYRHLYETATQDPTVIGLRLYVEKENLSAQNAYRKMGMIEEPYRFMEAYPLTGKVAHVQS